MPSPTAAGFVPFSPKATAAWTLPFTAYFVILGERVVYHRLKTWTILGNRTNAEAQPQSDKPLLGPPPKLEHDKVFISSRTHGNFAEYVPLAFVIAAIAELNGGKPKTIHYAMATLLAMRIAHVELGMKIQNSLGLGRILSFQGTQGWLLGMAGYAFYLVKDTLTL